MRIHDISVPLAPTLPVYPGDPSVRIDPWSQISEGEAANVSRVIISTHSGTHIDAPRHFDDQGATVDQIPLPLLIGPALVVEIPEVKVIGRRELERLPVRGVGRLLLKTDNSMLWKRSSFTSDFAALSVDGAQYLMECGVKLVGIDYLSMERYEGDGSVHRALLDGGALILEGLNLSDVPAGEYELICLPLRIAGGDGAPVRAILRGGAGPNEDSHFDPHTTKWPLS
ncbi:cyclase family protein [Geomonas sp. RF6]|uniref:cyclase family protein n=1 Tax=Geomonas sp. RF6 TaxID=2897342 RepID=UPI001E5BC390|nr:cyclase family protein [Geomonas sp. RF6]UFS71784.1 cyclase family protein [Geomonas sp. RF6]